MTTKFESKKNEEKVTREDGPGLFVRSWHPAGQPRAAVAIVHGFNSHGGYYSWVGEMFAAAGIVAYALDLRGRGQSDGERYFISDIHEYTADVEVLIHLVKSREPDLPVFLLGHSAGGVVSCTYTLEHQSGIAGLICESFAFQVYAPDFALAVVKGLSHIAPHAHVLKLPNQEFSRDPAVVEQLNQDPFVAHEVQPTSTVAALVRADERLKAEFSSITLPVLILHGSEDKVTRPGGSQLFYDTAGSTDKTLKIYEGYFHDLLSDVGKEAVFSDILTWIDARIG